MGSPSSTSGRFSEEEDGPTAVEYAVMLAVDPSWFVWWLLRRWEPALTRHSETGLGDRVLS